MTKLLIFIKNPEAGKVKTRLAKTLGTKKAMEIYLRLLRHTRKIASALPFESILYYSNFVDNNDDWPEDSFTKLPQKGEDLGERMSEAFKEQLRNADKVLIIGSDCAQLREAHLINAEAALENHDLVMGPALDGGYYLLGMKSFHDYLFTDMPWSSPGLQNITLDRIEAHGHTVALLDPLSDVDTEEEWVKYGKPFIAD